jgi:hypothetical protein
MDAVSLISSRKLLAFPSRSSPVPSRARIERVTLKVADAAAGGSTGEFGCDVVALSE